MRGLTHPRFFFGDIIRRRARAGSPVRQRKVVSKKLFPKIEGFCGELLEVRVNENLMWKILKVNGEWGTGRLEEEKGKSPYFIQTFEHSNIQTFS